MRGNASIGALVTNYAMGQSPPLSVHGLGSAVRISIRACKIFRSQSSFLRSFSALSATLDHSSFRGFLETPFFLTSTVSGVTFTSWQNLSSNSTASFIQCTFSDCTSSSGGGAIYVYSSSTVLSIMQCAFIRCTSTLTGCSAGAVDVYQATQAIITSTTFSLCSCVSDVNSIHIGAQCGGVSSCTFNSTCIDKCGTYVYTSSCGPVIGGSNYLCADLSNVTSSYGYDTTSGICFTLFKTGGYQISRLMVFNGSGPCFIGFFESTSVPTVQSSQFVNNTISEGWVKFLLTTCAGAQFVGCRFGGMSSNIISTSSGTVSSTHCSFENCCFESAIPNAYTSDHSFVSTKIGNCFIYLTAGFTPLHENVSIFGVILIESIIYMVN